jgi:Gram-negative bacterial TonB protein C-terminal
VSIDFRIAAITIAVALTGAAARAGDIATYPALICEKFCAHVTPATPVEPLPPFFHAGANQAGFVDVNFVVGVDGHSKDAIVERAVGPHALVDAALDALNHIVWHPATADGAAVAESKRYRFEFSDGGVPEAIADKECDTATAPSAIAGATIPELLTNAKCAAQWQAREGDYAAALKASRIATIDEGRWLAPEARERALRLRVELEAQAGEMGEAMMAFDTLQKVDEVPLQAGDPDVALMARIYTAIDADKPLTSAGVVAADGGDLLWQHVLFRRTFAFSDVNGKLDRFTIRCGTHSFGSPVIDNGAWNVPGGWTACVLYVFGTAKTTFNLIESSTPAVAREPHRQ